MRVNIVVQPNETGGSKEVFKKLAEIQDTFEDDKCGKCGSDNLKYSVRTVEDNEFYELRCKKCKAKLSFGTSKAEPNKLYPKRFLTDNKGKAIKGEDGKSVIKGNWGWVKWNPEKEVEE